MDGPEEGTGRLAVNSTLKKKERKKERREGRNKWMYKCTSKTIHLTCFIFHWVYLTWNNCLLFNPILCYTTATVMSILFVTKQLYWWLFGGHYVNDFTHVTKRTGVNRPLICTETHSNVNAGCYEMTWLTVVARVRYIMITCYNIQHKLHIIISFTPNMSCSFNWSCTLAYVLDKYKIKMNHEVWHHCKC